VVVFDGSDAYFAVGEGYAAYRGPATGGTAHRHAAFQVAIAVRGEVGIVDSSGVRHRGVALVVAPMVRHRMLAGTALLTFFVEPHCAFADQLRERYGDGVTVAGELRGLREEEVLLSRPSRALDPRLVEAMELVTGRGRSMPDVAAQVGLSPQRLRALARQQLGMPLARWRVWVRLRRTAEALREGQSLADAAIVGGFADQAHLTRWMREMMGLTPAATLPALRPYPRWAS
jgi:AraC-like DNA-binding protein